MLARRHGRGSKLKSLVLSLPRHKKPVERHCPYHRGHQKVLMSHQTLVYNPRVSRGRVYTPGAHPGGVKRPHQKSSWSGCDKNVSRIYEARTTVSVGVLPGGLRDGGRVLAGVARPAHRVRQGQLP